jgi:hypothetical protein
MLVKSLVLLNPIGLYISTNPAPTGDHEFFIKVTCFIGENFRGTKMQKRKQSTPPPSIRFAQSTRPQRHKSTSPPDTGHPGPDQPRCLS